MKLPPLARKVVADAVYSTTVNPQVLPYTNPPTHGHSVLLAIRATGGRSMSGATVADTQGNTFYYLGQSANTTGPRISVWFGWIITPVTTNDSINIGVTLGFQGTVLAVSFAGIYAAAGFSDSSGTSNNTAGGISSLTASLSSNTTDAPEIIVAALATGNDTDTAIASGWDHTWHQSAGSTQHRTHIADLQKLTTGAQSVTFTWSDGGTTAAIFMVALRPSDRNYLGNFLGMA